MTWKLVCEAVIFALVGQLVTTAWFFVKVEEGNRALARGIAARAVRGELYHYGPNVALVGTDVWLSDGTRLVVRFCHSNKYLVKDCRPNLDMEKVEPEFWAAYKADRDRRGYGVLVSLALGSVGFRDGKTYYGIADDKCEMCTKNAATVECAHGILCDECSKQLHASIKCEVQPWPWSSARK